MSKSTADNMQSVSSNAVYNAIGGSKIKYKDIELMLQSLSWSHYMIGTTYRGYYINLPLSNYITDAGAVPLSVIQWWWTQLARDTPFFIGLDSMGVNLSIAIGDTGRLTSATKIIVRVYYLVP